MLAVVICAIALSLAYPVREYIGQRRQIDQLEAQRQTIEIQVHKLELSTARLTNPAFVEQQARDRLHMCFPTQTCYVVIARRRPAGPGGPTAQARGHPVVRAPVALGPRRDQVPGE